MKEILRRRTIPGYPLKYHSSKVVAQIGSNSYPLADEVTKVVNLSSYPLERIYQEIAYIAYHFHWSLESVTGMAHNERNRWVQEIARINERLNENWREGLKLSEPGGGSPSRYL